MYSRDELNDFEASYMETALWSSTDDNDVPLDDASHNEELAPKTIARIKKDCNAFLAKALPIINAMDYVLDDFNVAHDFWLTRNGHGAGFWDGDYPEPLGQQLTDLAKSFGEINLYIGDDGKLYFA